MSDLNATITHDSTARTFTLIYEDGMEFKIIETYNVKTGATEHDVLTEVNEGVFKPATVSQKAEIMGDFHRLYKG